MSLKLNKRSAQSSPLTTKQEDDNKTATENAVNSLSSGGAGTVTTFSVASVPTGLTASVANPTTTPALTLATTLSGYLKGNGANVISAVATIPFTDTTGTVPVNRGGTDLTTVGTEYTVLGSGNGVIAYITLQSTDNKLQVAGANHNQINFTITESNLVISNMTGTLAIAHGGTGATTAQAARVNLLPSLSGNTLKFLQVNSGETDAQWTTISSGITSINGDSTAAQTIVAGTNPNSSFNISTAGGVTTLNILAATASNGGVVTTASQTFAGTKTFSSSPALTALTPASILFLTTSSVVAEDATNLTWDNTNKVLVTSNIWTTGTTKTTNFQTKSGTYQALITDYILYGDTTGGSFTITLPDISTVYPAQSIIVKLITGASNLSVKPTGGSQYIDGSNSPVVITGGSLGYIEVIPHGANNWRVLRIKLT